MKLFTEFTPQMTGVDLPYGLLTKNVSRKNGKCVYHFLGQHIDLITYNKPFTLILYYLSSNHQ